MVSREALPKDLLFLSYISASLNGSQKAVTLLRMETMQIHTIIPLAMDISTLKTRVPKSASELPQSNGKSANVFLWRKYVSKKARRRFKTSREFCG